MSRMQPKTNIKTFRCTADRHTKVIDLPGDINTFETLKGDPTSSYKGGDRIYTYLVSLIFCETKCFLTINPCINFRLGTSFHKIKKANYQLSYQYQP